MVFHAIAFWLLVLAVPLWGYRWFLYHGLAPRERLVFRRIVRQHHENTYLFGLRIFGFLAAVAATVFALVLGLRYLKTGSTELGAYRDMMRTRLYSGMDPVDSALDTFHYDQIAPIAVLTACFVLAVGFTLVSAALRDISLIKRLRRKLVRISGNDEGPAGSSA